MNNKRVNNNSPGRAYHPTISTPGTFDSGLVELVHMCMYRPWYGSLTIASCKMYSRDAEGARATSDTV